MSFTLSAIVYHLVRSTSNMQVCEKDTMQVCEKDTVCCFCEQTVKKPV